MSVPVFDLVDAHVVGGHADDLALDDGTARWTFARLLEEVAAFGGVLRHCGIVPGDRVVVALPDCPEAVVAVLAAARVGAVPWLGGTTAGEKVLATASTEVDALRAATADVVLVRQRSGAGRELREGHDYDWDVVMRAGRTDPAPCVDGAAVATDDPRVRAWVDALAARTALHLPPSG